MQVGPGFFTSLKASGLKLNLLAVGIVLLSGVITVIIYKVADIPLPVILGILSGAVTNTPSLGAGGETLLTLGEKASQVNMMGTGYAMAYPFAICGIFLVIWLLRVIFRINIDEEAEAIAAKEKQNTELLQTMNIVVHNPNVEGVALGQLPVFEDEKVVCSRMKRGEQLMVKR